MNITDCLAALAPFFRPLTSSLSLLQAPQKLHFRTLELEGGNLEETFEPQVPNFQACATLKGNTGKPSPTTLLDFVKEIHGNL